MSIARWFRDRRLPAAIVVLALLAGGAQMLLWWIEPEAQTRDFVGPPRSGYVLLNARVVEYTTEGKPGFHVQSPHVERREGDDSLYFNLPTFELASKKPGVPAWKGRSLYGWTDKSGSLLKLQGPVHVRRPAYAHEDAIDLHTSDVTAWPKDNRMETAAKAQITQGERTMSGVGLRANLNENHLELLDESQGSFPPRKRKS